MFRLWEELYGGAYQRLPELVTEILGGVAQGGGGISILPSGPRRVPPREPSVRSILPILAALELLTLVDDREVETARRALLNAVASIVKQTNES
nr:hypothetical protein [Pyrinomonadaceae bacterium]